MGMRLPVWISRVAPTLVLVCAASAGAATDLAVGELLIQGAVLQVHPVHQEIDPGRPTVVWTTLGDIPPSQLAAGLRVVGELSGPGLEAPLRLSAVPGEPFRIPGLNREGAYTLSGIRLVDDGQVLLGAEPDTVEIVVHRLVVASVTSRPLTRDEIGAHGIVIGDDSYTAWRYTVGFAIEGGTYEIPFDLLYGPDGVTLLPDQDPYTLPVPRPDRPELPLPQVTPVFFEVPGADIPDGTPEPPGAGGSTIPGFLVIPTDVAFLHQFFSVILVVQNAALEDSGIELHDLSAVLGLSGDGLRQARTEPPSVPGEPVPVVDPGPDGELGTGDDLVFVVARTQAQASWLVEGLEQGRHLVTVDLGGEVHGLASGEPAPFSGQIPGVVLVRDPRFALTFFHPWTVRSGEEYPLRVVVANTSTTPVYDLSLTLPSGSVSGALLLHPVDAIVVDELLPGDAVSVEWQLQSLRTGVVTASAFNSSGPLDASFQFTVGVGELGIPLSPESIVLPPEVNALPAAVTAPALELLGLAHSLATAPEGTEIDLPPVGETAVVLRGQELAACARRAAIGEATDRALVSFGLSWLGTAAWSPGFDALRRQSSRGHELESQLAAALGRRIDDTGAGPAMAELEELCLGGRETLLVLARGAGYSGSARLVISGLVSGATAAGQAADTTLFARTLAGAAILEVVAGDWSGEVGVVAIPFDEESAWLESGYQVQLHGTGSGSVDIELVHVLADGSSRRFAPSAPVPVAPSSLSFVSVTPDADTATLYVDANGDRIQDSWEEIAAVVADPPLPTVLVARFDATLQPPDGGPYNDLLLLFSQPLDLAALEDVDPDTWTITSDLELPLDDGGVFTWSRTHAGSALTSRGDPRLLLVTAAGPLNPHAVLALSSGPDGTPFPGDRRLDLVAEPIAVAGGLATGVLRGLVIGADGTPLPGAVVELYESVRVDSALDGATWWRSLSDRMTADADGTFVLDAVRFRDHQVPARYAPFLLRAFDPANGHETRLQARLPGDATVRDLTVTMLGRGDVVGTVTREDGSPLETPMVFGRSVTNPAEGASAVPDATGAFRLTDLPVGPVQILARDGHSYTWATAMIPGPGQEAVVDIVLPLTTPPPLARVEGTVLDGETLETVPGVQVFLTPEGFGAATHVELTDDDGAFVIDDAPPGIATFAVFDPVRGRYVAEQLADLRGDATNTVQIVIATPASGAIRGTVYLLEAGARTPAAGAYVVARQTGSWAVASTDGSYLLEDLPLGRITVEAFQPDGSAAATRTIDLVADGQELVVDLDLVTSSGRLLVHVVDRDGFPVPGVSVAVEYFGSGDEATTTGDGSAEITGLLPGSHDVLASLGSRLGKGAARIEYSGQAVETTVVLGGLVDVDVETIATTQGGGTARVLSQILYRQPGITPSGRIGLVPADGYAGGTVDPDTLLTSLVGLPEGVGSLIVRAENPFHGAVTVSEPLVPSAEPILVTINLETPGTIAGRVLAGEGSDPQPGAQVELWSPLDGTLVSFARVEADADGAFSFGLVTPGNLSIRAFDEVGGGVGWVNGSIEPGQTVPALDVILRGVGGISGTVVVCSGGTPSSGEEARVTLRAQGAPRPVIDGVDIPGLQDRELDVDLADGVFAFTGLTAGRWELRVRSAIHGSALQVVDIAGDGAVVPLVEPVCLLPAGSLSGRVVEPETGSGVGSVTVQLFQDIAGIDELLSADLSAEDGSFLFADLPVERRYSVRAHDAASNRGGVSERVLLCAPDNPPECWLDATLDVVLAGLGTVQGAVRHADGSPVETATVRLTTSIATSADGEIMLALRRWLAFTTPDGGYSFAGIPTGRVEVEAFDPDSPLFAEATVWVDPVVEPTTTVDLELPAFDTVDVAVLDPTGAAVDDPGLVVALRQRSKSQFREPTGAAAEIRHLGTPVDGVVADLFQVGACLGACGGYSFDELLAHRFVDALGGALDDDMPTPPEARQVEIQLMARAAARIAVTRDGAPVEGADVTLAGSGFYGSLATTTQTGSDGATPVIPNLGVGIYTAAATITDTSGNTLRGAGDLVISQADHGTTVAVEVAVEQAAAADGQVLASDGSLATGSLVTVRMGGGSGRLFQTLVASDGSFLFSGLPLGESYNLEVFEADGPGRFALDAVDIGPGTVDADGILHFGTLALDDLNPDLATVVPANGTQEVAVDSSVVLEFSERMRHATLDDARLSLRRQGAADPLPVTIVLADDGDATRVTLEPAGPLTSDTLFVVQVLVGVEDLAGRTLVADRTVTFRTRDAIPPQVVMVNPADDPSGVTPVGPNETPVITFSEVVDAASINDTTVRLLEDGTPVTFGLTVERDGFDVRLSPATGLSLDTFYTVEVSGASDPSGNTLAATFTSTFRIRDDQPPLVTLLPPAGAAVDGDTWSAVEGRPVVLRAAVTSNDALANVVLSVNGVPLPDLPVLDGGSGEHQLPFTLPRGVDSITLSVQAADVSGNPSQVASHALELVVDLPPSGSLAVAPADAVSPNHLLAITIDASDDHGLMAAHLVLSGAFDHSASIDLTGTAAQAMTEVRVPVDAPAAQVVVACEVEDTLGQRTPLPPHSVTVLADTGAPVVTALEPLPGAAFVSGDTVSFRFQLTDDVAVDSATLEVDGAPVAVGVGSVQLPGDAWRATATATWTAPAVGATTTVNFTLLVADPAGNQTPYDSSFTIDPVTSPEAPVVVFTCPVSGDGCAPDIGVLIRFTITDDDLIDSYTASVNGEVVVPDTPVDARFTTRSFSWTPPAGAIAGDVFVVRVDATDNAPHKGFATMTLVVPEGTLLTAGTTPVLDASYNGQALVLAGGVITATEPLALESLNLIQGATLTGESGEALVVSTSGTLHVGCGAAISADGLGYAGGDPVTHPDGWAPDSVDASAGASGGSHGGLGDSAHPADVAGEVFGPLHQPHHGGGGGSADPAGTDPAASGGGVIELAAAVIELEGEIRAQGAGTAGGDRGAGAGGSVLVDAAVLRGRGVVDASGGPSRTSFDGRWAAAGGGGRVAVYADDIDGFDPATQIVAAGGITSSYSHTPLRAAGDGTVFVLETATMTHGELHVGRGECSGLPTAGTPLPALGSGQVGVTEADGADLWIEPADPDARFDLGVEGLWLRIAGTDYPVVAQDGRRRILVGGAAATVVAGDSFQGVALFDRVVVAGCATLITPDLTEAGEIVVGAGAAVSPANAEAPTIGQIHLGAADRKFTVSADAGAVTDPDGIAAVVLRNTATGDEIDLDLNPDGSIDEQSFVGGAGHDAMELVARDGHAAARAAIAAVGSLPANAGKPEIDDTGLIDFFADANANYSVVGGAGAVDDPEPPLEITVTNLATSVQRTTTAAADGSFSVEVDGSYQDPFQLTVTDGHPEPRTETRDLGGMPDLVPPVIDPEKLHTSAHQRLFWASGFADAVTDDHGVASAYLYDPADPGFGTVPVTIAANGSFPSTVVSAATNTVLHLVVEDVGGNTSESALPALPTNLQGPTISTPYVRRTTDQGVYLLEDVGYEDWNDPSCCYALYSADGIETVRLENRDTPGHGPWQATFSGYWGNFVGPFYFDPVTITGALGDEIWIVAEDGHPVWLADEARVWSALPQIPDAPLIGAVTLEYAGSAYHLVVPAGAITGDPGPLALTARVWRSDGDSWTEVGGATASIDSGASVDLVLSGGSAGDLVVLSATDNAATPRTTTTRVGQLPAVPSVSFSSARYWVAEDDAQVRVTVLLDGNPGGPVSVDWATADASATAGNDYTAASGTLVFDGDEQATLYVAVLDDADAEGDETVLLTLSNPSPGIAIGLRGTTELVIADTEGAPRPMALSVGVDAGNMLADTHDVDIADGIATFTPPLPEGPDRGDRVVCDDDYETFELFIRSCTDDSHCEVVTARGLPPEDRSGGWTDAVYPAFAYLDAAFDGAQSYLGTRDLAAANLALTLVCYGGSADTTPVSVPGDWVTSPEHTITVLAPTPLGQRGASQRHAGQWSDTAYRLEVSGGACLSSSVGHLCLEGLQLHCTGAPGSTVVGVDLGGASGTVDITETIIRLDRQPGTRVAIDTYAAGNLTLRVANSTLYDLGDGAEAWQAGISVWESTVTLYASNNTIVGGASGILVESGTTIARNNLVVDAATACFDGAFDVGSSHNLSSDGTAPGPAAHTGTAATFADAAGGDYHLGCSPLLLGPTVTHTALSSGQPADLFDGNTETMMVSAATNPAYVQLELAAPITFTGSSGCFAAADNRWTVAVADTAADMDSGTGSYQVVVPDRVVTGPHWAWDGISFAEPVTAPVIRLTVERLYGDDHVFINEWRLDGWNPACGGGLDLAADPDLRVVVDADSVIRTGGRDIGADQVRGLEISLDASWHEAWEAEGQATMDVVLSAPAPLPVSVRYFTQPWTATPGVDYLDVAGTLEFAPGTTRQTITVPVLADADDDDGEEFTVTLYDAAGATLATDWSPVALRDGEPPPRASLAVTGLQIPEGNGTALVEVVLDRVAAAQVWVGWTARDGTARTGQDFWPDSGGVTINQGSTSAFFELHLVDDDVDEADETVRLQLTSANGAQPGVPRLDWLKIVDDDDEPLVAVHPGLFTLDLDGCLPVLRAGTNAVAGASPLITVRVLVDNVMAEDDWWSDTVVIASGEPFAVDLLRVEPGSILVVEATPSAGDPVSATILTVASAPPAIDDGAITVYFADGQAEVAFPFTAVTDRLQSLGITVHNVTADQYRPVTDPCPATEDYFGSVAASPGDALAIQLCNGDGDPVCTTWIDLGTGGGS